MVLNCKKGWKYAIIVKFLTRKFDNLIRRIKIVQNKKIRNKAKKQRLRPNQLNHKNNKVLNKI